MDISAIIYSEEYKTIFEKKINLKYKEYCSRINEVGGKILVGYTEDGTKIMRAILFCPEEGLSREVNERLG